MFWAESLADAAMIAAPPISVGWSIAHCRACMPPSEPPTAASKRFDSELHPAGPGGPRPGPGPGPAGGSCSP